MLEKLESKVEDRRITKNKVEVADLKVTDTEDVSEDLVNVNKLHAQIDAVYRLVSNTNNRVERKLNYMDSKLGTILKAIENSGVDLEELQKQEEIKKLENKLKELKGGN